MATTTISAITAVLAGATTTSPLGFTVDDDDRVVILAPGGGTLDLSKLIIRVDNALGEGGPTAGGSIKFNIFASSSYSSKGIGVASFTVGSAASMIVGGKDFESARFLQASNQSVTIQASAVSATCMVEAFMLPNGFTA